MPLTDWRGEAFSGAKLAALHGDGLLTYRRDNKPGIPFPGLIDLPGGGREGGESPAECALRELAEEFGLVVPPVRLHYHCRYAASWDRASPSWFLAVHLTSAEISAIRFGEEGEDWRLMPVGDFLGHGEAIPHLQARLGHYLAGGNAGSVAGA
jgi:8-oxo-dGTP diphosphatase